ncbi:EAL domain-containing protein [Nitrosomonas sp.]|uniref:EAL domain-containing protein n=1 Tax=Nitrosomonas sp. TaxID=42353 RepID=UPI002605830E|nr:EAL domain-containing protein [Nitrosomonas sp.]MCW5600794.1 EAL domain-containing protein [Nitrosomonas sp.]
MRVLYIEDSSSDADLTRRILARSAPEIVLEIATTLAQGLALLNKPDAYDLLLTDLSLPDGTGLEALTLVRDRQLPIAVVIFTGYGDQDSAIAALKMGADDYLVKRDNYLEWLPRTLRTALSRFRNKAVHSQRTIRVLQVESNAVDAESIHQHLTHYAPHICLTTVVSPQDALASLPSSAGEDPDFDVLLVEYRLPGMDGLAFIKLLREDRKLDLPVVLITSQGSELVAAQALRLGVDDYVAKHEGYLYEVAAVIERVQYQAELAHERANLKEANLRLSHLLAASPAILYNLRLVGNIPHPVWVSDNIEQLLGYRSDQVLKPDWWCSHLHPDDREAALSRQPDLFIKDRLSHEYRFLNSAGQAVWIKDEARLIRNSLGKPLEIVGAWLDVTEHKRAEVIRQARQSVLDQIVANHPLPAILDDIARHLETIEADMLVSILLLDPYTKRLIHGAAPSLPEDYNAAITGLEVTDNTCPCGTAACCGEPVIVSNLDDHPYWDFFLTLTQKAGLHACWSVPFKNEMGQVLGLFTIYYTMPHEPEPADLELVDEFARITALAVQKVRNADALKQAATVFESTRDGVVITDLEPRIVAVNRAYMEITGYRKSEVIGKNPKLIKSGRHDQAFYQSMWNNLIQAGYWRGEIWNRRKNGEIYPQWLTISTVHDESGKPRNYVGVFTDISQIKQSEARLEHLAHYDPLTGLPNRLLAQSRLQHAIERADRNHYRVATLYLDLDRFKNVNDSLGHPAGDELLSLLANRLKSRLREEDTLARLGGDEFLLILEEIKDTRQAATVAQALIDQLTTPFTLPSGHKIFIGASIGISSYPDDAQCVTELIQHADMAMYLAKQEGRNTYRFHTKALSIAANERLALETRLRHALIANEFVLHYQPLIDARSNRIAGVEALVRWQPVDGEMVPPAKFIPITEETGLIVPLGEWILRTACNQARAWMDAGLPPLVMAVNLSVRQFQSENMVNMVRRVLADTGLPAEYLELELTETMFIERGEQSIATLKALKDLGVCLAIDDFGTGYSSLAYLKRFPIDKLKIDQSFVRDLAEDPNDREIAATIIAMARGLKLEVLAEGVETEQQLRFLQQHGCDYYQGYLFHRPAPPAQLDQWLRDKLLPKYQSVPN